MGPLNDALASHATVGLDTPVFIYYFEDAATYANLAEEAFQQIISGSMRGVTSVVTLTEALTRPIRLSRRDLADVYVSVLRLMPNLSTLPITTRTAEMAAHLRATYRLRTPDALQVAASLGAGATAFITNDRRLRQVRELEVIVLDDLLPAAAS